MGVFSTIRCIGGWIERPFNGEGDSGHKLFKFECLIDADKYAALALSTLITDASAASVAGLDQYPVGVWPVSADGNCYFVGDSPPQVHSGPVVKFVRTFANVPGSRTRGIGSYSHTWPAFRQWSGAQDALSNATIFDADNEHLPPDLLLRPELTTSSPAKITYTYTYATAIENVSTDIIWEPKWGNSSSYEGYQDLPTGNFLCNDGAGGQPYGTSPTLTTYKNNYIDDDYLVVASSIKHYLGNIFVRETIRALAQ